ncbi:unnamed protein product [Ixodes pacificus]
MPYAYRTNQKKMPRLFFNTYFCSIRPKMSDDNRTTMQGSLYFWHLLGRLRRKHARYKPCGDA